MAFDTSKLTPEELEEYNSYVDIFGPNSKSARNFEAQYGAAQAPVAAPVPVASRVENTLPELSGYMITDEEVQSAAGDAYDRRVRELWPSIKEKYVAEGMDSKEALERAKSDAAIQANKEVAKIKAKDRTPSGIPRAAGKLPTEEMGPIEAAWQAARPQELLSAEEVKKSKEPEAEARQVRSQIEGQLRAQSLRELGRAPTSSENIRWVNAKTDEKILTFLTNYKGLVTEEATDAYLRESRKTKEELEHSDYKKITQMAEDEFRGWAQAVFPEYEKGVKEEVTAVPEGKTSYFGSAKDLLTFEEDEGTIGEALALRAQAAFTEETETGAVVESAATTGLRNMAGLIRPVTEGAFSAFTYDVDAEGNPVDESDWNYKLAEASRNILEPWQEGQLTEEAFDSGLKQYLTLAGGILSAEADRTDIDDHEKAFISSGNLYRDVLMAHATARFTGDDLMDVPVTAQAFKNLGWENGPWWIGMGVELLLPITPTKPTQLAGKGIAAGLTGVGGGVRKGLSEAAMNATLLSDVAQFAGASKNIQRATRLAADAAQGLKSGAVTMEGYMNMTGDAITASIHPIQSARNLAYAAEMRAAHEQLLASARAGEMGEGSTSSLFLMMEPSARSAFGSQDLARIPLEDLEELMAMSSRDALKGIYGNALSKSEIAAQAAQEQAEELFRLVVKYKDAPIIKGSVNRTIGDLISDAVRVDDALSSRLVNDFITGAKKYKSGTGANTFVERLAGDDNQVVRVIAQEYSNINKTLDGLEAMFASNPSKAKNLIMDGRVADDVISSYVIATQRLAESGKYPMLKKVVDNMMGRLKNRKPPKLAGMPEPYKTRIVREYLGFDISELGLAPGRKGFILPAEAKRAIKTEAIRIILTERTAEKISNMFPNDLRLITPTIVVTEQAWMKGRAAFQKETARLGEVREVGSKFTFRNSEEVARAIILEFGPDKIAFNEKWRSVLSKILKGRALNEAEYTMAQALVKNSVARKVFKQSAPVRIMGPAYQRASVPVGRRFQTLRNIEDIGRLAAPLTERAAQMAEVAAKRGRFSNRDIFKGIGTALRNNKSKVTFVGKGIKKGPYARIETAELERVLSATFTNSTDLLKKELVDIQRNTSAKTRAQAFEVLMSRYFGTGNVRRKAYQEVISTFFDNTERGIVITEESFSKAYDDVAKKYAQGTTPAPSEEFAELIASLRKMHPYLDKAGLKSVFGNDQIAAAALTVIMRGKRQSLVTEVLKDFMAKYPDIFVKTGNIKGLTYPEDSFASRLQELVLTHTKEEDVVNDLLTETFTSGRLAPETLAVRGFDRVWARLPEEARDSIIRDFVNRIIIESDETLARYEPLHKQMQQRLMATVVEKSQIKDPLRGGVKEAVDRILKPVSERINLDAEKELQYLGTGQIIPEGPHRPLRPNLPADAGPADVLRDLRIRKLEETIDTITDALTEINKKIRKASGNKRKADQLLGDEASYRAVMDSPNHASRRGGTLNASIPNTIALAGRRLIESSAYEVDRMMNKLGMRVAGPEINMPQFIGSHLTNKQLIGTLTDPVTAKKLQELVDAANNGVLAENLTQLQKKPGLARFAMEGLRAMNRAAVGGMLGGFPLPNIAFHSNNIVSFPFITSVATPGYVAASIKSIPEAITAGIKGFAEAYPNIKAIQFADELFNDASRVGVNFTTKSGSEVVFIDKFGKKWTKNMLEEAMTRNELGMSQAAFEFGDRAISDLQRAAGVRGNLKQRRMVENFFHYMRPDDKNIWNIWAEESDKVLRKNIFLTSLKRGMPEDAAAELARRSILDYGKLGPQEKAFMARYAMFYTFQRKMAEDVVTTLVRPQAATNLAKVVRANQAQKKKNGSLWLESDWSMARLHSQWSKHTEDERYKTMFAGQQVPTIESMIMLLNTFDTLANGWLQSDDLGNLFTEKTNRSLDSMRKRFLNQPMLTLSWEALTSYRRNPESAPHGYVPSKYVMAWKGTGVWELMRDSIGIERIPTDRHIPGEPTFDGEQYRFSSAGSRRVFKIFEFASIISATNRNVVDYVQTITRSPIMAEGIDAVSFGLTDMQLQGAELKRAGEGEWYLYSPALKRPYKVSDEIALQLEMNKLAYRELRGLAKE